MEIFITTDHVLKLYTDILEEQVASKGFYNTLKFHSPFKFQLLDFDSFHLQVLQYLSNRNEGVDFTLQNILRRAFVNVNLYENLIDIQSDKSDTQVDPLWKIDENWDIERFDSEDDENFKKNIDDVKPQQFENHSFITFCYQIIDFLGATFLNNEHVQPTISSTGSETVTSPQLRADANHSQQSGLHQSVNQLTAGQIALFFYYLIMGKVEAPVKSEWGRMLKRYGFDNSYKHVYLCYCKIGKRKDDKGKIQDPMKKKNLAIVSGLLTKYPGAKALAEKDYYELEREFQD